MGAVQNGGDGRTRTDTDGHAETGTGLPRRFAGVLVRGVTAITGPWTCKNAITWALIIGAVLVFRWLVFEP